MMLDEAMGSTSPADQGSRQRSSYSSHSPKDEFPDLIPQSRRSDLSRNFVSPANQGISYSLHKPKDEFPDPIPQPRRSDLSPDLVFPANQGINQRSSYSLVHSPEDEFSDLSQDLVSPSFPFAQQSLQSLYSQEPSNEEPVRARRSIFPYNHNVIFRLLVWSVCTVFGILVILAIAALAIYLTIRPTVPTYSIQSVHIPTMDLRHIATPMSNGKGDYFDSFLNLDMNMTVESYNHNKNLKINYRSLMVAVEYGGLPIASTTMDPFQQNASSVLWIETEVKTTGLPLLSSVSSSFGIQISQGNVTFRVKIAARAKMRVGGIQSASFWAHPECIIMVVPPSTPTNETQLSSCNCKS